MVAAVTDILEPIGGPRFPGGYATSLDISDSRVAFREAFGYSWAGHGLTLDRAGAIDISAIPGYEKKGDGFQTISGVALSDNGARLVLGYKPDDHGSLVIQSRWSGDHRIADGKILGEFGPPRTGGVAVSVDGHGKYYGYSLSGAALFEYDITAITKGRHPAAQVGPGGLPGSLVASDATVAYVTATGQLVTFSHGSGACTTDESATCVAVDGQDLLMGVIGGTRREGVFTRLPGTPQAVTLLGSVPYAWVTVDGIQTLFRGATPIMVLPANEWPVVVSRGFGRQLYVGTTQHYLVVRVA